MARVGPARARFLAAAAALGAQLRADVAALEAAAKGARARVEPLGQAFTAAGEALIEAIRGNAMDDEDLDAARQEVIELYDNDLSHPDEENFDGVVDALRELTDDLRKQERELAAFVEAVQQVR